ncbi:MAG TPA: hypothetical protein DHV22_16110 [Xanthomarina gelatinilytica]|uniref:DUF306 domain-containing protein n=1 Tax=Xanthomarina gelatinilytica TaxID=1137281 RepID=A0A3D6BY76_9FLAO|nr:hypothetical protein [Xanthomarina gelatinilytica]
MKNLPLLFCAFLLFVSCSQENETENPVVNLQIDAREFETLSGIWNLEKVETLNSGNTSTPPSSVTIDFSLEDDSEISYVLNGNSTCNQYGGQLLSLKENSISFEQLYSTDMSCSDELNAFEGEYFSALFDTEEYKIEEGRLRLYSENKVLTFFR